jgi:hypothetical protein
MFGPLRAEMPGRLPVSELTSVSPNPSFGPTKIDFVVVRKQDVTMSVVDVSGRQVEALAKGSMEPGRYTLVWDPRRNAAPLASGVYFVRWEADGNVMEKRLVVMK